MAARYWVGGTGTWNATNTANWSATSGGAGGASVPTAADSVSFLSTSGTGTVTISGGARPCLSLNWNRSSLALARAATSDYIQAGNVTLLAITFGANISTATPWSQAPIYYSGVFTTSVSIPWGFGMSGGSLGSNVTCTSTQEMLWDGTDLAGYSVTGLKLNMGGGTSTSGSMGTGTFNLSGTGSVVYSTTVNPTTNINHDQSGVSFNITDTSASAKSVNFYENATGALNHGGGGDLSVGAYAGTISSVTVSGATTGKSISFPSAVTMVVDSLPSGTSDNPITLKSSSPSVNAVVNGSSGAISHSLSNVTLTRMTISVGSGEAYDSSDGGNNVGWTIRSKVPSLFFGADL